jgi:hypothetical protein
LFVPSFVRLFVCSFVCLFFCLFVCLFDGIRFNDAVSNSEYVQLNDLMMTVDQGCTNFPKKILGTTLKL